MSFLTASSRWVAVIKRDASADGHFVYCVKSTGIYCRPNCGARLARKENVEFHSSPADAAAAGYRPCKRCKPDLNEGYDVRTRVVERVCERIRNVGGDIKLWELADEMGWTPSYLHRVFKRKMGVTPKRYADRLKGDEAHCFNGGEIDLGKPQNRGKGVSVHYDSGSSGLTISAKPLCDGLATTVGLEHDCETNSSENIPLITGEDPRIAVAVNFMDFDTFLDQPHTGLPSDSIDGVEIDSLFDEKWPSISDTARAEVNSAATGVDLGSLETSLYPFNWIFPASPGVYLNLME